MRPLAIGLVAVVACAFTQAQAAAPSADDKEALRQGQQLYVAYCASCHGRDAKGTGPAASSLRSKPSDLTMLTRLNDGRFPRKRAYQVLRGELDKPVHGSKEMPIWGPIFLAEGGVTETDVERRIGNLIRYLESLQSGVVVRVPRKPVVDTLHFEEVCSR